MWRWLPMLLAVVLTSSGHAREPQSQARFPSHPDFKITPEAGAMPKALMKFQRTAISLAKFPAIDFHFPPRTLIPRPDPEDGRRLSEVDQN